MHTFFLVCILHGHISDWHRHYLTQLHRVELVQYNQAKADTEELEYLLSHTLPQPKP